MDMLISLGIFVFIGVGIVVIFIYLFEHGSKLITRIFSSSPPEAEERLSPYDYVRKDYLMTKRESEFFKRLESIVSGRYYVFPQVHLSSLLNHKVKTNTSWRGALSKIQRKSVDYVLVDRQTLVTCYAIELDDRTHDSEGRAARDAFVNEIFKYAQMPLVRLRDVELLSDDAIISALSVAHMSEISNE